VVVYTLVQREAHIVQLVDLIGILDVVAYLVIYDTCGDESVDGRGTIAYQILGLPGYLANF